MKLYKAVLIILASLQSFFAAAQELNCQVEINYSSLQGTANRQIFDQMQRSIFDFMNNTKWTNDAFTVQEKIECSILIILDRVSGTEDYGGKIQVTSRRPVYNSSYYTQLLNIEDEDFQIKFQQFTQLEFNLNTFQNNLTSILQFYAYVIIASDYDSFGPLGGTTHWQKAQLVVQNASNATEPGWKQNAAKGDRNRYWLAENQIQPVFKGIRDCNYEYSRKGLDKMFENQDEARAVILKALEMLLPVYKARLVTYNMQVFFNAKRDEIVNIFKGGTPEEKTKLLELLGTIDPAGTTKYSKIQG
jgi:hypothetical protein